MSFSFSFFPFILIRGNAVVEETGDTIRDTVVLTVRGDGVDIPPWFIKHTSKTASFASGRRCAGDEMPIKGMNTSLMIEYINHVADHITEPSLLVMDRLSSHKAAAVFQHLRTFVTSTGQQLLTPFLLPAKSAFLISPLDMGAIAAFKSNFYKEKRSTLEEKQQAMQRAWHQVSNDSLRNIFHHCGLVGEEDIASICQRFMKEVVGEVPEQLEATLDYYDAWVSGAIEVDGADPGRGVTDEAPLQLTEARLDGKYWQNYGYKRP